MRDKQTFLMKGQFAFYFRSSWLYGQILPRNALVGLTNRFELLFVGTCQIIDSSVPILHLIDIPVIITWVAIATFVLLS